MIQGRALSTGRRNGVAAVEFAVCLPVLVLVIIGSIEACTMVFLKESLTVAAYEGSRAALKPGATSADVVTRCNEVLTERSVEGGTVEVSPSNLGSIAAGGTLQISVTAPCEPNGVVPVWFYGDASLTGNSFVMKEY
jgi:Flp pilus assembly protein TadG